MPREVCLAPPIHIFQCPKLPNFWPVVFALFCIFIFGILPSKTELKRLLPSRSLFATLFCYTFVTLQVIKLLSSIYSQFKLFVLNLNFVHCLELIDVFSANERSEMFACILLKMK